MHEFLCGCIFSKSFSLVDASDDDPIFIDILLGSVGKGDIEPLPQDLLGLWASWGAGYPSQWGGGKVVGNLKTRLQY